MGPLEKLSEKLAACHGKTQYNSKAAAIRDRTRMAKQRNSGSRAGLLAYRCPHCGMFHLGRP